MKPCKHPCCPDNGPCRKAKKSNPRKAIRKVSLKEQKRLRTYSAQKKTEFTDQPVCAVALLENKTEKVIKLFQHCQYWATEKHHPAGRIGERLYDVGKKVCNNCHRILEERPLMAKELGLSESRLINQSNQ